MLKKFLTVVAVLLGTVFTLSAENLLELKNCRPGPGQAPQAPALEVANVPGIGTAVLVKPVAQGNYQGMNVLLPQPVSGEDIESISFKFGQNARKNRTGDAAIILHFDSKKVLPGQFKFSAKEWNPVTVKLAPENFPALQKQSLAKYGKIVRISFSIFSSLNKPGQFLGVADLQIARKKQESSAAAGAETAVQAAAGNQYAELKLWKGMNGKAPTPPDLRSSEVPGVGKAVTAVAVSKGAYQGMEIILPEPVDLNNVGAVTFDFGQSVWKKRAGAGSIIFKYDKRNGLMGVFNFEKSQWSKVRVPIDLRTLKALSKQSQPVAGKVKTIQFSMFAAFDTPGEFIGVANLTFEPKAAGNKSSLIKVNNYRHIAPPTWGDRSGKVLTDGVTAEADQAMFRQYADNPDMVFDLGALYLIDRIEVAAVAVPGQNISDYSVYTSKDNRQWRMSAHVRNQDTSTEKKTIVLPVKNFR